MKKISYLLCILLVAICLTGCNDKKENVSTSNDSVQKELTPQEKYNKAMTLLEDDEKSAIELLRDIPEYQDSKTYIDNYDFKHRFDGTYFYVSGDIESAVERNPSQRIVINGLDIETSYIWYGYFSSDLYNSGNTYYKGRGRTRNKKMTCNEELTICKAFYLTSVDEDGYYEETFDENAKNLYEIETYKFEKDLITVSSHYIIKKYDFDRDSTSAYKKINNDTELPEESKPTEYQKDPKIGMTKEEVERSTWGYPKKINKDTYSWGTKEQWVYDKGYIYFRDGIVTSISESKE